MENLVCAELFNGVSLEMLQDKMLLVLNDGGLFAVTTDENAQNYKEDFYPLNVEMISHYGIVTTDTTIRSNYG